MSADPATIAFYQQQAPHYVLNFAQGPSRDLDAFLDRLAPESFVLELGCGGGRDAAHMVQRGFLADATDGTPAMVRKAHERHNLAARVMQFDELDAIAKYDAVWAHASLLHCPRDALPDTLQRIHRAMKPGGWHYANFKLGQGEGRDSLGRLYNFPEEAWLTECYTAIAGWRIIERTHYQGGGFDNVLRDWIALTIRKDA